MSTKRPPGGMTAAEHDEWLKATGQYEQVRAVQAAKAAKHNARIQATIASDKPVSDDLRAAGFEVESVDDLFNRKEPWRKDVPIPAYPDAIPILLKHLGTCAHFRTNEAIVRALTDPDGRVAFDRIVAELRRTTARRMPRANSGGPST